MVAHSFNPGTLEAEAGGSLSSRTARATTEQKPCLKTKTKTMNKERKRKIKERLHSLQKRVLTHSLSWIPKDHLLSRSGVGGPVLPTMGKASEQPGRQKSHSGSSQPLMRVQGDSDFYALLWIHLPISSLHYHSPKKAGQ